MTADCIFRTSKAATPSVCIIFDASGDVAASVADVAAVENELTPAIIESVESQFKQAPFAMIDGDLCVATIEVRSLGFVVDYVPITSWRQYPAAIFFCSSSSFKMYSLPLIPQQQQFCL